MNDKSNPLLPPNSEAGLGDTTQMLVEVASQIQPEPAFVGGLERQLAAAHKGEEVPSVLTLRRLAPVLLWILAAAAFVLVIDWAIRSIVPAPIPAARTTPTGTQRAPAPEIEASTPMPPSRSYEWNGTTLYLAAPLPDSPIEARVYPAQAAPEAGVEEAMALARRFGIDGQIYQEPGEVRGTSNYMVTDGKQMLHVRSAGYFSYTADMIRSFNYFGAVQKPDAAGVISEFLQAHGFTFPYRVEWSDYRSGYLVAPLTPEGTPLRYEDYAQPMMMVKLNDQGQVATLDASLLTVTGASRGTFGIISADEAFRRLMSNPVAGMIESLHSIPPPMSQWSRSYPTDQPLSIYGYVSSASPVEPNQAAFIRIDGFPAVGQPAGLEQLPPQTYVEAAGRFILENGIEKFSVDSWKVSNVNEDGLVGAMQRENGQVSLTTQDGVRYVLPDVPADLPMPFENAYVIGTREGDVFHWKIIDNRMAAQGSGGGGGGGGGNGFHKLNLSGTPVPFPTPAATAEASTAGGDQYVVQAGDTLSGIAWTYKTDVESLMQANSIKDPGTLTVGQVLVIPGSGPRSVEALRGILSITIQKHPDGSEQVAYGFLADARSNPGGYMLLEGKNLEQLQSYNSRPVDIWGTLETPEGSANPVVKVERFSIPFPDLKLEVRKGTQKLTQINGQAATLLVADDGSTYVQLLADGTTGSSLIGVEGDKIQIECLAVPGESVGGYPALRVFSGGLAISPKTGQPMELPITSDKPSVVEIPAAIVNPQIPTLTIEKVELVHFTSDRRFAAGTAAGPAYFQPVWRFYGHYSNGDEFEALIQALKDEYLLPELEPATQPG